MLTRPLTPVFPVFEITFEYFEFEAFTGIIGYWGMIERSGVFLRGGGVLMKK